MHGVEPAVLSIYCAVFTVFVFLRFVSCIFCNSFFCPHWFLCCSLGLGSYELLCLCSLYHVETNGDMHSYRVGGCGFKASVCQSG